MTNEIKNRINQINQGIVPDGYKKTKMGIVPAEWNNVKFDTLFESMSEYTSDTEKYPLYSLTIENGVTAKTDRYERSHLVKKENSYKLLKPNYFAFNPMNIRFGAVARHKGNNNVLVSGYYDVFTIKEPTDLKFMDNYLVSNNMITYYNRVSTGSLIEKQRVHFSQFLEFNLPLPTVHERRKIAEILSVKEKLIELKEKLIEEKLLNKKYLMQQLLNRKFRLKEFNGDWKTVKLGSVCKMFSGGTPLTSRREFYNGNIPFIRSAEINLNTTELTISEIGFEKSSAKMVVKGDLLYAMYGANSGDCAISKQNGAINQAILCIRSNNSIPYLYYILLNDKEDIIRTYIQGGQGNLSGDIIKNIKVNIPPIEEQNAIAEILATADKEIELLKQDLEQEKLKKKALMQLLLTGIVRVNNG